jgi:hypothetical protein
MLSDLIDLMADLTAEYLPLVLLLVLIAVCVCGGLLHLLPK